MGPQARFITSEICQVGGPGQTDQNDAAIYLVHFADAAVLIDAGSGRASDRVLMNIEADQKTLGELENAFKFNDAVLRHLTVLKKKADTGPSSMMKTVEREETRKTQQAEYNA